MPMYQCFHVVHLANVGLPGLGFIGEFRLLLVPSSNTWVAFLPPLA